ncbi:MAG: transposase [Pirellulales bacterium]|nr:transposase [Pirellulales bacterium]
MLRKLYEEAHSFHADRYFSGWSDIALPLERGIDIVIRKHQARRTDFRTGERLGKDDHLIFWTRPQRPKWMSVEQYAALPEELTLLLNPEQYPPEEIALLYQRRWRAELHLRSLKIVLQAEDVDEYYILFPSRSVGTSVCRRCTSEP